MNQENRMTVIENAWPTICSFEWLLEAHRNARKGKRYRPEIMGFTSKLEDNLFLVQLCMKDGNYELGPYRKLWVYIPKKRLVIIMIPNRKAETIVKALDALERRYGAVNFRKIFRSITVDNGSEFAMADGIERSAINKTLPRTKVYFCHPYSSWERGSNENQNLMIRRKHPKGTDFAKVTKTEIEATAQWINNYPRRILGYMSSEILFKQCLREIGLAA